MFGDSTTLPLSTGSVVLTKVNSGENYSGEYRSAASATESYRMMIRHSKAKPLSDGTPRVRHNVEIVHTVFATSATLAVVRKTYIVSELGENDPSLVLIDGLADWLIATSNANTVKLLNSES